MLRRDAVEGRRPRRGWSRPRKTDWRTVAGVGSSGGLTKGGGRRDICHRRHRQSHQERRKESRKCPVMPIMCRTASFRPSCCRSPTIWRSTKRASASTCRDVAAIEGLSAITINAHSTEVASCSFDEQRRVLDIAQDEIGGRLPIVNGVWADGSLEAARIARMAEEGGASALLVFPPAPFTLGQSPAMAIEHFKRIADAIEPAADRVPVSAGDRAGLSARHAPEDGRGGADHPRHQGLGRQCSAARDAHPRAAKPQAAGQRAVHPQRLAVEFAGARLQRASLRLAAASSPTCRRRCSGRSRPTTSPRRAGSTTAFIRWPGCSMPSPGPTCITA